MKHIQIIILVLIFSACQSNTGKMDAKVSFAETEHDFELVEYKLPVQHLFLVKSSGETPLIINKVETSCGCTVPEWTKKPIKPDKNGEIKITYNSDFPGKFRKTITVYYNGANSPDTLIIKGEVELPAEMKNQ